MNLYGRTNANVYNFCRLSELLLFTARPHIHLGQVLSSHSIVSSSRNVRPCASRGDRWIGHWRTTWSTICSSTPHSQAPEGPNANCVSEAETSDTGAGTVKPNQRGSRKGHSGRVGAGIGDESMKSRSVVLPLHLPSAILPERRTYVLLSRNAIINALCPQGDLIYGRPPGFKSPPAPAGVMG